MTLAAVAYDESQDALQLEFRSGAIYQYLGVPAGVHEELLDAASKGSYFNRVIRGRFPYRLLVNPEAGTSNVLRSEGAWITSAAAVSSSRSSKVFSKWFARPGKLFCMSCFARNCSSTSSKWWIDYHPTSVW